MPSRAAQLVARKMMGANGLSGAITVLFPQAARSCPYRETKACRFSATPPRWRHVPIEFLHRRQAAYGSVSWIRGFTVPFVLALGPDAAQEVFANNDRSFSQQGQEFFSGRFFKRGLMFLDFDEHHFHRRIMQEAFTRERLSGYLQSMDAVCAEATATLGAAEVLMYPYLKRTLLDIATVVFMGGQPGPHSDVMNQAFTACLRGASAVVRFPVPGLRWAAGLKGRRTLEEHFHPNSMTGAAPAAGTFRGILPCHDNDGNQFTDDDVVDHMIFLMSAATETSAAAATAALHQLALHPEWQDRVRAESSAAIGDGGSIRMPWTACRR